MKKKICELCSHRQCTNRTSLQVKKERPDLADKMTRNFGFSMGIEFRDAALSITANSTAVAKKDMVFNVNLGISGLTNKDAGDAKGRDIALFIGKQEKMVLLKTNLRFDRFFFLGRRHRGGPL